MKRAIVGTAGHIDHGKTKLIEALTGIDCDRWEEEKRRGITIDLGFAHLEEPDIQIGFVDVPGHQRFLDNALAGLGGIRLMLLVVAADEGVMPQTREHLAICSLLGIQCGLVALTKSDLAAPDRISQVELEVEELLASTPFAGSPVRAVSAVTGVGVDELRDQLVELARSTATEEGVERPARLPIDRAFALKGLGLVVTGTLAAGEIAVGDKLSALPGGASGRVRSVQVHGEDRQGARTGERTALRLSGIEAPEVARGSQLITPQAYATTKRLLARLTLLPEAAVPLEGPQAMRLYIFSDEVVAKVAPIGASELLPGQSGDVEIRTARPMVAARGDRFIVRRPSPASTLGGGEILDPFWTRPGTRRLELVLRGIGQSDRAALGCWLAQAGIAGLGGRSTGQRLGVQQAAATAMLSELTSAGLAVEARARGDRDPRFLAPTALEAVAGRARKVLARHFEQDRLAESMSKAEAVRRILPAGAAPLADFYLDWLSSQQILVVDGQQVSLPGRTAELSNEESKLATDIQELFARAGLTPPAPREVPGLLNAKPQIVEGVITHLLRRGRLVRLPGGLILAAAAVEDLRSDLVAAGWTAFRIADFKKRFGITRKWAIPLLEHLDSIGFTRRIEDRRQIVGAALPGKEAK